MKFTHLTRNNNYPSTRRREYLKDLLWLRSSFEDRNPEPFAMVLIETWSFAMVSIRIATLIETLIEPWSKPLFQKVAIVSIRVAIETLNRNPETTMFRFFLKIDTLGVFYGFDYGFCFDRNHTKVFPV